MNKDHGFPSIPFNEICRFLYKKGLGRMVSPLARGIVKRSILPATNFHTLQISKITKEFERFWGLKDQNPTFVQNPNFSTFTLGNPKCLWSYYFPTTSSIAGLRQTYQLEPFQVKTSDNAELCGMHFKEKRADHKNARTLIVFNGNGELYKIGSAAWILRLLQRSPIPFNVVMFDHRECGNSSGKANATGLILDGEAIYNYVHTVLKVPKDQIDLCGFSLGGAIATLIKYKHKDSNGALISNRSFHSLENAVSGYFKKLPTPFSRLFGNLASLLAKKSDWKLDPFHAWENMPGRKMVICHEKDPIISYCASLEKALFDKDLTKECHHILLRQKKPDDLIRNHHVQPLCSYNDQNGNDVEKEILSFLLKF